MFDIWNIFGVIAVVTLFIFSKGKNAIWGGLTFGLIIGIIISLVYVFIGSNFNWLIIKKSVIIGTLTGVLAELLGKLSQALKRK